MTVTDRPMFDLSVSEEKNCKIFHLKGRLMDQQQADHLMKALDDELSGEIIRSFWTSGICNT